MPRQKISDYRTEKQEQIRDLVQEDVITCPQLLACYHQAHICGLYKSCLVDVFKEIQFNEQDEKETAKPQEIVQILPPIELFNHAWKNACQRYKYCDFG